MIYLVAGILICIVAMAYVLSSSASIIWCVLGFGIGIYLIVTGKKKLGFIKKK